MYTYSMQQSPSSEANWFSASQEIPCILWNPKVRYHIHMCPPHVPILSQFHPDHTPIINFLKIHLNIILQLCLSLPSGLIPFSHQNPVFASPLPHKGYRPHPSHFS